MFDASYTNEAEKSKYSNLRNEVMELLRGRRNAQALKRFLIGIGMPKMFVYLLPLTPGWRTMKALAPTLEYDMLLTHDTPPLDRMAEIKIPTNIVYGEKSPASIHEVAKDLANAIPNAKLSMLAGQDHMASAKVVLPLLSSFFKASQM